MGAKMKILFITHYAGIYGSNLSLLYLIIYLKQNFNVQPLVLINEQGEFTDRLLEEGIPFMQCFYNNSVVNKSKRFSFMKRIKLLIVKYPTYYLAYKKVNRYYSYELVHSNSSVIDIGYYISKWKKVPHIWHIREFGRLDFNLINISSKRNTIKKYYETDRIIAISESIKEMLLELGNHLNVTKVFNGVEISKKYDKHYFENNRTNFCIVGSVSTHKNQLEIIRACNLLKDRGYKAFSLTIIGDGGRKYISLLNNFITENCLEDYVFFKGYCTNVDDTLKKMDVGIVSSLKEAFGRVTIEYMGNYLPVIGTNSGGTAELITDSENGYLYESGNYEQLADIMEQFMGNYDLIQKMGSKARENSLAYTAKENAQRIYSVYEETLINKVQNRQPSDNL